MALTLTMLQMIVFIVVILINFSFTLDTRIGVYVPLSCDNLSNKYQATIESAAQFISSSDLYSAIATTFETHDSCDEAVALDTLMRNLSNGSISNHVTIGPGLHALCDPIVRLAHYYNKSLVSALCTQKELDTFSDYGYFMRTVPSSNKVAEAISELLYDFLWKRVAIVTSTSSECWTFVKDVYYQITTDEFIVENVIEIEYGFDATSVLRQLNTIASSAKGRDIYCMF